MKINKILFVMLIAGVLLSACSPQNAATPAAPVPGTAAPAPASTIVANGPATCKAVSLFPTPGPETASLFPPISGQDWKLGPDNALITFIEYSDFQ